jgi:hypothetical protein
MRLLWRLRKGTELPDAKFVRCYLELFTGRGSYEISQQNEAAGICLRKLSSTAGKFIFVTEKMPQ